MIPVTGSEMAANTTFTSILNEIQLSNLNFTINVTPFAAYITLKKTLQKDLDGNLAVPAPSLLFKTMFRQPTTRVQCLPGPKDQLCNHLEKSQRQGILLIMDELKVSLQGPSTMEVTSPEVLIIKVHHQIPIHSTVIPAQVLPSNLKFIPRITMEEEAHLPPIITLGTNFPLHHQFHLDIYALPGSITTKGHQRASEIQGLPSAQIKQTRWYQDCFGKCC